MSEREVPTPTIAVFDPDERLVPVVAALERGGIDSVERVSTLSALERIGAVACLVVLDAPETPERPAVDGIETLQKVRAAFESPPPVVIYTTREGNDIAAEGLSAGAADVLRVPPSRAALLARRIQDVVEDSPPEPPAQQLESLLEYYPTKIYLKDTDSRFVNVTRSMTEDKATTATQRVGLTDYELYPPELADDLFEEEQRLMTNGESIEEKIEYFSQDGEDTWVSTTKVPRYDEEGQLLGLVGDVVDVTHLKQQEQMMARLHSASRRLIRAESRQEIGAVAIDIAAEMDAFPHARLVLYETDTPYHTRVDTWETPGAFRWDDDTFEAAFGSEDVHYRTESGALHQAKLDPDQDDHSASEQPRPDVVSVRIPLGDHGVFGLEGEDEPIDSFTLELGQVLAANVEAVLDRAAHEQQLDRQIERLEEFATIGSHELRNRLQIALGATQQAAAGDTAAAQRAVDTLERMTRMTSQLLTLARTGSVKSGTVPNRLSAAVDTASEAVTSGATVTVERDAVVVADNDGLVELLSILLRNASDRAEDVTVRVSATADGFSVADDGAPIPERSREELFEPNYNGDGVNPDGTLYIVSVIATAHDWDIDISTSEMGGTQFTFSNVELDGE